MAGPAEAQRGQPYIEDFRGLPMQEVDFAAWLRAITPGPHDVMRRVWSDREVPDSSGSQVFLF